MRVAGAADPGFELLSPGQGGFTLVYGSAKPTPARRQKKVARRPRAKSSRHYRLLCGRAGSQRGVRPRLCAPRRWSLLSAGQTFKEEFSASSSTTVKLVRRKTARVRFVASLALRPWRGGLPRIWKRKGKSARNAGSPTLARNISCVRRTASRSRCGCVGIVSTSMPVSNYLFAILFTPTGSPMRFRSSKITRSMLASAAPKHDPPNSLSGL